MKTLESYPKEWMHATIHLNPETGELHSDGDHRVREWILARLDLAQPAPKCTCEGPGEGCSICAQPAPERRIPVYLSTGDGPEGEYSARSKRGEHYQQLVYLVFPPDPTPPESAEPTEEQDG